MKHFFTKLFFVLSIGSLCASEKPPQMTPVERFEMRRECDQAKWEMKVEKERLSKEGSIRSQIDAAKDEEIMNGNTFVFKLPSASGGGSSWFKNMFTNAAVTSESISDEDLWEKDDSKAGVKPAEDTPSLLSAINIGFYRNDFKRLLLFAGDWASDIIFHKKLKDRRIEFITKQVEADPKRLATLLEKINANPAAYLYFEEVGLWEKIKRKFKKAPDEVTAFNDYFSQEHAFIGWNPVRSEILLPVLIKFITQECSRELHKGAEKFDYFNFCSYCSYEKDENGERKLVPGMGISIVTLLHLFFSPSGSTLGNGLQGTGIFSKGLPVGMTQESFSKYAMMGEMGGMVGFKQPKFFRDLLTNEWAPLLCRVASFLGTIMMYDQVFQDKWKEYILHHRDELIILLDQYSAAKKRCDNEEVIRLQGSLKQFVIAGHEGDSYLFIKNLGSWFTARVSSEMNIMQAVQAVLTIQMLYGYFKYMKFMFRMGQY